MEQVEEISLVETGVEQALPIERPTERLWLGVTLCALAGVSYGGQAIFAKWAYVEGVTVSMMLAMRFVTAGLGVWLWLLLTRRPVRVERARLGGLVGLGLLFVTNSLFFYLSLNEMGAGTATLLVYTFPGLTVIWATLFLKERLDGRKVIALVLALLGCLLTVDPVAVLAGGSKFSWLGAVFALGSAFSNSIYVTLSGRFSRGVPGLLAAAYSIPVTALAFVGWNALTGGFQFELSGWAWLCCLAVGLGTAFSIGTAFAGVQLIGPSRTAITITTEPATAVLLGILLLGEPASPLKLTGGLLILTAVVLLSRPGNSNNVAAGE